MLPPPPEANFTLEKITEEIDKVLANAQNEPYKKQVDLALETMFTTLTNMGSKLNEDYEGGITDKKLLDDSDAYVMHHSKYYYRAFLISSRIESLEKHL